MNSDLERAGVAVSPSQRGWAILAIGLATTAGMWAFAYISLLRPGLLVGEFIFAAMLSTLVCGGFVAGRFAGGGWKSGAAVGLVAAGFNLLIVGSLFGDAGAEGFAGRALLWTGGTIIGSAILSAIGGAVGGRFALSTEGLRINSPRRVAECDWYGVFTKTVVVTAFMLLITGGIVTGWEVGLAVPDWPQSFGHNMILYPLTQMTSEEAVQSGVHFEHAHRLYGMLVGVATITLAATIWFVDSRKWLGALVIGALLLVLLQGVMGGFRVTETSTALAIVHGVSGQIIVALLAAIAGFTSTDWLLQRDVVERDSVGTDRTLSIVLIGLLILQLALGASFRHLNAQPEIAGPMVIGILHSHILVGVLILAAVLLVGIRSVSLYRDQHRASRSGKMLMHTVGLQIALGIVALIAVLTRETTEPIPTWEVVITTLHQATGALLLALATLHVLWTRRLLRAPA